MLYFILGKQPWFWFFLACIIYGKLPDSWWFSSACVIYHNKPVLNWRFTNVRHCEGLPIVSLGYCSGCTTSKKGFILFPVTFSYSYCNRTIAVENDESNKPQTSKYGVLFQPAQRIARNARPWRTVWWHVQVTAATTNMLRTYEQDMWAA